MKFNLITRLGATFHITENPDSPIIPAPSPDTPGVFTNEYLYTGFLSKDKITFEEICSLSIKVLVDGDAETVQYPYDEDGYIWFCSTKPIKSIVDIYRFPVDHVFEGTFNAKLDDESAPVTVYCYRTLYELVSNSWTFTIGF